MPKSTEDIVRDAIMEIMPCEASDIKPETSFVDDLHIDSLDAVEILMAIEDAMNIEIPDEDAEKIKTFGALVKYLDERRKT